MRLTNNIDYKTKGTRAPLSAASPRDMKYCGGGGGALVIKVNKFFCG